MTISVTLCTDMHDWTWKPTLFRSAWQWVGTWLCFELRVAK